MRHTLIITLISFIGFTSGIMLVKLIKKDTVSETVSSETVSSETVTTWDNEGTTHIILISDIVETVQQGDNCIIYCDKITIISTEPCDDKFNNNKFNIEGCEE